MLTDLAQEAINLLRSRRLFLVPVESCTGGALASEITNISGASEILTNAYVLYSTEAKIKLGVRAEIIERHSVYSVETATELARVGLIQASRGDVGIGITGSLSRVDPHNPNSKPGEIYIAVKWRDRLIQKKIEIRDENRKSSKEKIVQVALSMLLEILKSEV